MIKFDNIETSGWRHAITSMRNPLESWSKSDSFFGLINTEYSDEDWFVADAWVRNAYPDINDESTLYAELFDDYDTWLLREGILKKSKDETVCDCAFIGPKDLKLAKNLIKAGDDESKFMRMIHFQCDIAAPLFWWKELDTYKVATVRNSCSTMHKLASTPITKDCFSWDGFSGLELIDPTGDPDVFLDEAISNCEQLRQLYNQTGDKKYWRALIELLPDGWLVKATYDCSYQTLRHIVQAREHHKLVEWHDFCNMTKDLPYGMELIWEGK